MTPLRISFFVLMGAITVFFLLLIAIAMMRVLGAPVQNHHESSEEILMVDLLVKNDIQIAVKTIIADQKIENQLTELLPGTSILIVQNAENDGLYVVDMFHNLVRVDCVHPSRKYNVVGGRYRDTVFCVGNASVVDRCGPMASGGYILNEINAVFTLPDTAGHAVLFLGQDTAFLTIDSSQSSHCVLTVYNEQQKGCIQVSMKDHQDAFCVRVFPGINHVVIVNHELVLQTEMTPFY